MVAVHVPRDIPQPHALHVRMSRNDVGCDVATRFEAANAAGHALSPSFMTHWTKPGSSRDGAHAPPPQPAPVPFAAQASACAFHVGGGAAPGTPPDGVHEIDIVGVAARAEISV